MGCQETFTRNLQDIPSSIFDVKSINVQVAGLALNVSSGFGALRMCQQGGTLVQAASSVGFDASNANLTKLITQQIDNLNVNSLINNLGLQ